MKVFDVRGKQITIDEKEVISIYFGSGNYTEQLDVEHEMPGIKLASYPAQRSSFSVNFKGDV